MPAFVQYQAAVVLARCRGGDVSNVVKYACQGMDATIMFFAQALTLELEEVYTQNVVWQEVRSIK